MTRTTMCSRIAGVLGVLLASTCMAQAQPGSQQAAMSASLKRFLQVWDNDKEKRTRYVAAFHDLNGDGKPEAFAYLVSNSQCVKSGCPTLILKQNGGTWEIVTKVMSTRPPVRVAKGSSNGWRNVSVWVDGDEPHGGHEAELSYDGKTYPTDPAAPLVPHVQEGAEGEALILYAKDGVALYE